MTRCVRPAASMARLAIRAKVGPILPATPRTITSPSARRIASIAASDGSLSSSSRCATSRIETGISIGGYYDSRASARRRVDPQDDASRRHRRVGALPRQPLESDGAGLAVLPDRGSARGARRRGRGARHRHGRDASLRFVHVDFDGARRSRRPRQACGHDPAAARARARRPGRDGAPRCDSLGRSHLSQDRIRQRISPRPMVSRRHAADRPPIRRATCHPNGLAGDSRDGPACVWRFAPGLASTSGRRIAGVRTGDPTRQRRAGVCVRASRPQPGPPRPARRRLSGHRGGAARLDLDANNRIAASTSTCPTIDRSGGTSSRGSVSRSSGRFCGCTVASSRRPENRPRSMRSPGRSSADRWATRLRS